MAIENLLEEYSEELQALNVRMDGQYNLAEMESIRDRCKSHREHQQLLDRIEKLEKRVARLEELDQCFG